MNFGNAAHAAVRRRGSAATLLHAGVRCPLFAQALRHAYARPDDPGRVLYP